MIFNVHLDTISMDIQQQITKGLPISQIYSIAISKYQTALVISPGATV